VKANISYTVGISKTRWSDGYLKSPVKPIASVRETRDINILHSDVSSSPDPEA